MYVCSDRVLFNNAGRRRLYSNPPASVQGFRGLTPGQCLVSWSMCDIARWLSFLICEIINKYTTSMIYFNTIDENILKNVNTTCSSGIHLCLRIIHKKHKPQLLNKKKEWCKEERAHPRFHLYHKTRSD